MKFILMIAACFSLTSGADPITETCQRDTRQETILRAQKKAPAMSTAQANASVNGAVPAAEYALQSDTAVCVADKIRVALDSPSNYQYYCLMAQAKTRIDCFKAWQEKQDIAYAKQILQLARTAYDMAAIDSRAPQADTKKIGMTVVDAWVSEIEHYTPTKNVLYQHFGPTRDALRRQEDADFKKARRQILYMAELQLSYMLHKQKRSPASATGSSERTKLLALQKRIKQLVRVH